MAARPALLEDVPPPVEIVSFAVERVPRARPARVVPDRTPPGYEFIKRIRRRYDVAIGTHRNFDPRVQSTVEHRVGRRIEDVLGTVCPVGAIYDRFEHEYRVPIDLRVAWSWPALPMWLAVGEVSATRCALRLSLRSRHRIRYPKRYFSSAHAALTAIESRL